jgi:hypothetical protein
MDFSSRNPTLPLIIAQQIWAQLHTERADLIIDFIHYTNFMENQIFNKPLEFFIYKFVLDLSPSSLLSIRMAKFFFSFRLLLDPNYLT